ncbi:MAG: NrfD/PsrC family molybdoenzyme membrane anchor subunit, partial [Acidobacteriota bacterium]
MAERPLFRDELNGLRDRSLDRITDDLCRSVERHAGFAWWSAFALSALMAVAGLVAVIYQVRTGIGTWGLNRSVGWALDITNFVFWIGIGHAGTFISAILYLLRQRWRVAISRSAEAGTLLAVTCAALFPIIHLGRPWLAFWMLPYPNFRGPLWINFRSPLVWDFFAIGTYFSVSLAFFYLGLLPDLATLRDRPGSGPWKRVLGWASLGWDGSQSTWHRWQTLYLLLAGLATALVISVHTIVSWDFAVSILPGWHSTIFPPYFVVGAIFSG